MTNGDVSDDLYLLAAVDVRWYCICGAVFVFRQANRAEYHLEDTKLGFRG